MLILIKYLLDSSQKLIINVLPQQWFKKDVHNCLT